MSEDDIDTLGPDCDASNQATGEGRTPRFGWTPAYEKTFFQSLCESVQLGLRENSSFKAEAWARAAEAIEKSHGAYPTKNHLINKSDNARKRFRLWRGLREHPDFTYNPNTRAVTAPKDVWSAHILVRRHPSVHLNGPADLGQKEPMSRALRGRPFEHEDFMEILYPDVIGSGGAPKRTTKSKRRLDDFPDSDLPGTGILNLQMDSSTGGGVDKHGAHSALSPAAPSRARPATLPPQSASGQSPAVQTPTEDCCNPSRKRALPQECWDDGFDARPSSSSATPCSAVHAAPSPGKRSRLLTQMDALSSALGVTTSFAAEPSPAAVTPLPDSRNGPGLKEADATRKDSSRLHWQEAALDIFFVEFGNLGTDLQLMITEAVLCDEYKSLLFCKMPCQVRQRWVAQLGEAYSK